MIKSDFNWQNLPESEFSLWDSWVYSQPSGSWFHTVRAFQIVHDRIPEILILKDEQQNWVAGFPFIRSRKFGLSYPKRSPFLYFSSPVISDSYKKNLGFVLEGLKKQFSFSILNMSYQNSEWPETKHESEKQFGYWLPLEKNDELQLSKCSENHKRQLKKNLEGIIDFIQPSELNENEIGLVHQSYQDHGKESPFSTEKIFGIFSKLKSEEAIIARYMLNEKILGWRCWLIDPRGFWIDWMSGINRSESTESFGQHLCFESFKKARESGNSGIDFGGANTPGVSDFKKRFGCETHYGNLIILAKNKIFRNMLKLKDGN